MSRNRNSKQIKISRRQSLAILGSATVAAGLDPVNMLIKGLVDGLINQAHASSIPGGKPPRNYLYLSFPNGPCRWHWDQPLAPYSGLNDPSYTYPTAAMNPGIATRFQGTSGVTTQYATTVVTASNGTKLRMPHIWSWTIPTSSGTWVPMSSLIDNMAFIRGLISLDGHTDSRTIQLMPRPGMPSIDGAVADRSTAAILALSLNHSPYNAYKSGKGIGNIRIENLTPAYNPLAKILAPFDRTGDSLGSSYTAYPTSSASPTLGRRDALKAGIDRAMAALGAAAKARTPGAEILWSNRGTAEALITKGIGDVSAVYSSKLLKYQTLIQKCVYEHKNRNAAGIMDRDHIFANWPANQRPSTFVANAHDFFTYDSNPAYCTMIENLPETMAIAEYLFEMGYSSAVVGSCVAVRMLQRPGYLAWGWDEHYDGTVMSMIINSFMFRCVAACLYEFVQTMKAAGKFEETVVHMGGEFSRSPRLDMTGSDHSPNGNAISLLSGAIKSPFAIGNTQPGTGSYAGNYGLGEVMDIEGGKRVPGASHIASTLAHMLRVNSPAPNDISLVAETSNGIVPTVELAKQKGES